MSAALIRVVLADVRARLTDPRRWVQGTYAGMRTGAVVVPLWQLRDKSRANCWCVGSAITLAVGKVCTGNDVAWTELRSDVERELLLTLDAIGIKDNRGKKYRAIAQYNDWPSTAHADVLACIDETVARLSAAA